MRTTVKATLSARRVELLLFALLWLTYAYFYQSTQHNEAARFDQTRAIVEQGVLSIDAFRYNTADVVEIAREGRPRHVYPNKAPGTSLLAVGPFWFWMHALKVFHFPQWVYWHVVAYLTALTTIGLLSALAAVAMFVLLRRLSGDVVFSALAVLAIWLGTICFPFSTLFFSHQQAAAQLVLAFYFLFKLRHGRLAAMRWPFAQIALAGFLCGFTVATEYPTLLLVAALGGYFVAAILRIEARRRQRVLVATAFGAGLAVGLSILAAYNLAVAGNVWFVPYQQYAEQGTAAAFPGHGKGVVGVHWPGWRQFFFVLGQITIGPQRGLLYIGLEGLRVYACNPVLWLALPGVVWLWRRKTFRVEAALVCAMTVAYLTFNACFGDSIVYWGGAWSVGPRHLVPAIPFLALPLIEGARRLWFLFYPLLLVSVFYMLLATAVEPRVPYEFSNPARTLFLDNYLRGHLAVNPQGLFDREGRLLTANSNAFNLAKVAGCPGTYQLAPLLVFWLVAGIALLWAGWTLRKGQRKESEDGDTPADENEEKRARATWSALLWPRFSPWVAAAVLALFVVAVAAMPAAHDQRVRRELATPGGLTGTYYPNARWRGQPAFLRKDVVLDFDWTLDPPLPWPFSIEWVGTIRLDRPGEYRFATESDDGSFLALGLNLVVDNGGIHSRRRVMGRPVEVKTPLTTRISVRYFNQQLAGGIRVTWQPPGQPERRLPSDVLEPEGLEAAAR